MSNSGTLVVVRCTISRGGFSSERVFRVKGAGDNEHVGAAPVQYFFDENQKPLFSDQPPRGVNLDGFVAARVIVEQNSGTVLVSVPSGQVLRVSASEIIENPKESRVHVPI